MIPKYEVEINKLAEEHLMALPKEFGDWHMIYVRVNRWAKQGVLQATFLQLQQQGIIQIKVNVVSLDSTCIKVHPDEMGALKKGGPVHR